MNNLITNQIIMSSHDLMLKIEDFNYLEMIDAVIPSYNANGENVTTIVYTSGKCAVVDCTVDKFNMLWAKNFFMHIPTMRKWARKHIPCKELTPLLITKKILLIPIKSRKGRGTKASCYSWIRRDSIASYDGNHITLNSFIQIPYLSRISTLSDKIKESNLLYKTFLKEDLLRQNIYD